MSGSTRRTKANRRSDLPRLPPYRSAGSKRRDRGGERRKVERRVRAAGIWCDLGCAPLSCDARIVLKFTDAEFNCLQMRKAIYEFAWALRWSTRKWLPNLQEAQSRINAHFTDGRGKIFDLGFTAFEDDALEGDDEITVKEVEAVRCWFGEQFCGEKPFMLTNMPNLSAKGEERFKVAASILIAAYGELEDELIRLANQDRDLG